VRWGLRRPVALFSSLAVFSALAVVTLAVPAGASPSACQDICSVGFTTPAGNSTTGPLELGTVFTTTVLAESFDVCYWVAPGDTGTDPMTLWNNATQAGTSLGNASGAAAGSFACIRLTSMALAPGTYTISYTAPADFASEPDAVSASSSGPGIVGLSGISGSPGSFPTSSTGSDYGVAFNMISAPTDAPTITSATATTDPLQLNVNVTGDGDASSGFTVTCQAGSDSPVSANGVAPTIAVPGIGYSTAAAAVRCTAVETSQAAPNPYYFGDPNITSPPSATFAVPYAPPTTSGPGCAATLTAPTALTSAPGEKSAVVSWAPATANPSSCISGYVVTPITGSVVGSPVMIMGPGTTTVIGGLTDGTPYTFTVAAVSGSGVGPQSSSTGPVIIGAPAKPNALSASKVAGGAIKVSFKAGSTNGASITKFTAACLSSNHGVVRQVSAASGPLTVKGLSAGRTYMCAVSATNSRGRSHWSLPSRAIRA
jgi:hypothetical protein